MTDRLAQPKRAERQILMAAAVITGVLVLALLLALVVSLRSEVPQAVPPASDAMSAQTVSPVPPVEASQRQMLLERPLFWESRRPLAPAEAIDEPVDEEQVADELKQLTVLGVFSDGEVGGMIVLFKQQRQRVAVGESIAGWELDSVSADKVTMTRDGRRSNLPLERKQAAKTNSNTSKPKRTMEASNRRNTLR